MDYNQYWNIIESVQNELSASLTIQQRELLLRNEREPITPSWNEYKKNSRNLRLTSDSNSKLSSQSFPMNHSRFTVNSETNMERTPTVGSNYDNRFREDNSLIRGVSDPLHKASLSKNNRLPASSRGDSLEAPSFYDHVPSPLTQSPKLLPSLTSLTLPPLKPVNCESTLKSLDEDAFMHESTLDHYLNGSMEQYDTIKNSIKTETLIASLDAPKDDTLRKMFEEEEKASRVAESYASRLHIPEVNTLAIDCQDENEDGYSWSLKQSVIEENQQDSSFFPLHYQPQQSFKPLSPILYTSAADLVTSTFVPSSHTDSSLPLEPLEPLEDQPLEPTNLELSSDEDSNRKSSLMSFASSHTVLSSQQLTNGPIQADRYNFSEDEPSNDSMWEDYRDSTLDGLYLSKRFTERYWIEREQDDNDAGESVEETTIYISDDNSLEG